MNTKNALINIGGIMMGSAVLLVLMNDGFNIFNNYYSMSRLSFELFIGGIIICLISLAFKKDPSDKSPNTKREGKKDGL